jgi:hypothetical protein
VWALRAQALKSLACKRATKVKNAKMVNIFLNYLPISPVILYDIVLFIIITY